MAQWKDNEEIKIFREYLKIPTVISNESPTVNYEPCVKFLRKQAEDIGLTFSVFHPSKANKPVVILTMEGSKPEMPTIMLNSHMDVVPAFEEFWTHKPFAADIDEHGNIFARGTQDTKSIGTQYLAALRYYKRNNIQFDRTIHVTFVPDEETGGLNGMKTFVESDFFKKMNVTFALDENGSSMQKDVFSIAYGERARWLVKFRIVSEAGHGADLFEKTASEKLVCLLNKVYDFRKTQQEILKKDPLDFSNTTAINLTMIKGGVLGNVIPSEYVLELDVRIGPNVDHDQLENMIKKWCEEIENVEYCFGEKGAQVAPSHFEGCCSNFCNGLAKAVEEMGFKLFPFITPASSDANYLRAKGVSAFGFCPISEIPVRAHQHDEFLPGDMYLKGIEVYKKIIENIGNC